MAANTFLGSVWSGGIEKSRLLLQGNEHAVHAVPAVLPQVEERGGRVREREGRPALVVSSTSWTPDEDFGLLLKAAEAS